MDLTEGSETAANINQTLGIHPKVDKVNTEHSESLKSSGIYFEDPYLQYGNVTKSRLRREIAPLLPLFPP
jgi:hypothetical protein